MLYGLLRLPGALPFNPTGREGVSPAVAFNTAGTYDVDYRATDKVNNTSEPKRISFRILTGAGCTQTRSDEFDGSTLASKRVMAQIRPPARVST